MTSIKEIAKAYEPPKTENITDLEFIGTDMEVLTKTATKKDGEQFKYKYIVENNIEYRVPASVLKQLKAQLIAKPELKAFKVVKEGEGINTEYTVVPLK